MTSRGGLARNYEERMEKVRNQSSAMSLLLERPSARAVFSCRSRQSYIITFSGPNRLLCLLQRFFSALEGLDLAEEN